MPLRPILRYHGGKWNLAPWIIESFPTHRIYVEPYAGAASVLLRKPRSYSEVYNDLDKQIVNLFAVARDRGQELLKKLELTPYSREEFQLSFQPSSEPLEQARRTVVRSFLGLGSASATMEMNESGNLPTGFRAFARKQGSSPAKDWRNYPGGLSAIIRRLQGVTIENKPAIEVIQSQDSPDTLFYIDPPYVAESRDPGSDYRHEMTRQDHCQLAEILRAVQGRVAISCYDTYLYRKLYSGWYMKTRRAYADGGSPRTEVLLMNYPPPMQLSFDTAKEE